MFTGPTMSGYSWNRQVPRAPLPDLRCYRLVRVVSGTTWEGITPPSSLLRTHAPNPLPPADFVSLIRPVFAGCCPSLLEKGRSRRDLCNPCTGVWTPTPPPSSGALVRFFPEDIGLTIQVSRSACGKVSAMQLQQSLLSRGCSHSLMFKRPYSLDPRVAPTVAPSGTRQLGLIHHAELGSLPSQAVASLYD